LVDWPFQKGSLTSPPPIVVHVHTILCASFWLLRWSSCFYAKHTLFAFITCGSSTPMSPSPPIGRIEALRAPRSAVGRAWGRCHCGRGHGSLCRDGDCAPSRGGVPESKDAYGLRLHVHAVFFPLPSSPLPICRNARLLLFFSRERPSLSFNTSHFIAVRESLPSSLAPRPCSNTRIMPTSALNSIYVYIYIYILGHWRLPGSLVGDYGDSGVCGDGFRPLGGRAHGQRHPQHPQNCVYVGGKRRACVCLCGHVCVRVLDT